MILHSNFTIGHNLINEVKTYLDEIHSKDCYDLVICNERKGWVLYEDTVLLKDVPYFSQKAIGRLALSGKRVLLFDDAIFRGDTAKSIKENVMKAGAAKVDIASYVKLKTAKLETLPPCHLVDKEEFEEYHDLLRQYMSSRIISPDTDHMYAIGNFNKKIEHEALMIALGALGRVYIDDLDSPVKKIGLKELKILKWTDLPFPSHVKDFPLWKIRINFEESGKFCVFPIGFPDMDEEGYVPSHDFEYCLCKKYLDETWKKSHQNAEWLLSCYCIVFNAQVALLKAFLKNMKTLKETKQYSFDYVRYSDARNVFGDPTLEKKLQDDFTKIVRT